MPQSKFYILIDVHLFCTYVRLTCSLLRLTIKDVFQYTVFSDSANYQTCQTFNVIMNFPKSCFKYAKREYYIFLIYKELQSYITTEKEKRKRKREIQSFKIKKRNSYQETFYKKLQTEAKRHPPYRKRVR